MKPFVLPASTSMAALAGAITILVSMVLRRFGWELTFEEGQALTLVAAVLVGHLVNDSPKPSVAREAVADAAADEAKGK